MQKRFLHLQNHFSILEYHSETRKTPKEVKNLGWLLRNWKLVASFDLSKVTGLPYDAVLTAHLKPNSKKIHSYVSSFAAYSIAENFLKRPVFFGLKLNGKIISKA